MTAVAQEVIIAGGGLAGLTLGLGLRSRSVPTTILEAQDYPRHRVCGEFLSGRGLRFLDELGLRPALMRAGARLARTVAFFGPQRCLAGGQLPEPALCLSRHALDALLARAFVERGGQLRTGTRVRAEEWSGPGRVRATGRRPSAPDQGWRWLGLKAHVTGVRLTADLELHLLEDGYVGLCAVEEGRVNVCGLFRHRAAPSELHDRWPEVLKGPEASCLRRTLSVGTFDAASFCAVAGISLRPRRATSSPDCVTGDCIGMIPPATGNGMSMALESAALAVDPLERWSRGDLDWITSRRSLAESCDAAFRSRLRWASWLQAWILEPRRQGLVMALLPWAPWVWRVLYHRTR